MDYRWENREREKIKDDAIRSQTTMILFDCVPIQQSGNTGSISSYAFEGGAIIIPIYQMRKPGFAEIK